MKLFRVTYDIVTPESAEQGDTAEIGYVTPGQWHWSIDESSGDDVSMTLREAIELTGCCLENCGRWFAQTDANQDYRTGAYESRSLHPPEHITAASYNRLKRLLTSH